MDGRENDVKMAIQDPHRIVPSRKRHNPKNAFGFELDTAQDTVRVMVVYDDPSKIVTGSTEGFVLTSYLVDPRFNSQVETPIYVKSATTTPGMAGKETK